MIKLFNRGNEGSGSGSGNGSPHSSFSPITSQSSANVTGPPRPIRLIYCDEKGKFLMDPEAVAVLQLVKEPIGIVSVCGRARQGKSFILNQLLGRSSGFQVASTHRPCTKGLWLWSTPLRRITLDGTEYNLLLLDSEGIDAFDQTGTYSTQIFSLAILLSSMFIYNQMGGIDEAALDRLSLVTQMTKHIRVRASGGKSTASELAQFSPIFVWLLRDFYLNLVEENQKITPRDYLELALQPVEGSGRDIVSKNGDFYLNLVEENQKITPRDYLELALQPVEGSGRDIVSKNEIRDSIRVLFPERECFTLVRPLNNESDLQRLDQLGLDRLRPEFRSGLDAFTKFVFERTRPKQVGSTVMTGPILVGIIQSYLDALNNGAVPTISSSWQSVEEAECQKAYDSAKEFYMANFDRSKPPEEATLREAHEKAVQRSLAIFSSGAVGTGSARKKYEALLQKFFRKAFEDFRRNAFMEADMLCSNSIQSMEKRLRAACHNPDANVDNVIKVLDVLLSEYEASSHGPGKWQKLAVFLQQSLEGPILDLAKRHMDRIASEKSTLFLKCRSIEDRMMLINKQLEASENSKSQYLKRYEDAMNDKRSLSDEYADRIAKLQSKCSSLDERCSSLLTTLGASRQESLDWKRKYEQVQSKHQVEEDQSSSEITVLKSRGSAAEARLAAAKEQVQSAQEEAQEWKRKFDIAARELKAALEKASIYQERSSKGTQLREDALRAEFADEMAQKEKEIKEKAAKLEHAERCLTVIKMELKAAQSRIESYNVEILSLKEEMKELGERLETAKARAQSYEREAITMEQEKIHLEQKYQSEFDRFEELQERCRNAEKEAKRATELADKARGEAVIAQKEKNEYQRLAVERMAAIERHQRHVESLERDKAELGDKLKESRIYESEAESKMSLLEARLEERENEIRSLLDSNNEQRASTVKVLEGLLDTERKGRAESNSIAEDLSFKLQAAQAKIDSLEQKLTAVVMNEKALDSKLKTASLGKRVRMDETAAEDAEEDDYTKFPGHKLKEELTKHNYGDELLKYRIPSKRQLVALFEKHILRK